MLKGRPRLLRWRWYLLFVFTAFAFVIGVLALLYLVFPPAPQTILLLGIDADGESASAQADAVILVNISPASFLVNVVSLPSDIWLTTSGGQLQQLRELYRPLETTPQDKAAAIRDVLEPNLGVSINHVVIVDMADVAALVDAIGGVKLDVERALIDDAFPVDEET
ncbi:MAG: LytR family transcriptional regulator, partial [Chloroflexi bacterium]